MKLIFLDIDGVMNCEDAYREGECKYYKDDILQYQTFYSKSKQLLNNLIDKTQAKIVISSTWRHSGLEYMRKVWKNEGMSGEIIDITPSMDFHKDKSLIINHSVPRGCEIDTWLNNHDFSHINWNQDWQQEKIDKSGIENYIIIDDDSDMLYNQRNHFVHVLPSPRNKQGFNQQYYEEALNKLSKSVIELNF